jgi:hypothetical protein
MVAGLPCCRLLLLAVTIPVAAQQPPLSAELVLAGKKQFEARCGGCHGVDGGVGNMDPTSWIRRIRALVQRKGIEKSFPTASPMRACRLSNFRNTNFSNSSPLS